MFLFDFWTFSLYLIYSPTSIFCLHFAAAFYIIIILPVPDIPPLFFFFFAIFPFSFSFLSCWEVGLFEISELRFALRFYCI